jgi:ABC-2 type transport system permease protein
MSDRPDYLRVFAVFARNSLVRDMTFRANFLIDAFTSMAWMGMQLGFYLLVFQVTPEIGRGTGWGEKEFFVFIATTILVNSLVQTFFMPNLSEFSEMIRTGGLDFALLKPIDAQFLISLQKIEWSSLANFVLALVLLIYAACGLETPPGPVQLLLYPLYILCGVAMLYSLMIVMSSLSVWMGRNQNLYDFWFYITNFSRYPMEIYRGEVGDPLRFVFTFLVPILIVVNVPARVMARPFDSEQWPLAIFTLFATLFCVILSRLAFTAALNSYRSASS